MKLRAYIWGIRMVTLCAVAAFVLVVRSVNPDSSGIAGKIIFFSVIFFALSGFFNLLLLRLRRKMITNETAFYNVGLSFRQGVLLSLLCVGLLILQGLRMLVWWDGLLLVGGVFLVELYFLSRIRSSGS